uniref:Cation-transporting ATPase n=1 Tax=Oryctolagus cuniculus TaxID=9986 RepID=A0A5F9CE61_RABIT
VSHVGAGAHALGPSSTEVFGYRTQRLQRALCLLTSVLTCGLLQLVFYWRPQWGVWASCLQCPLQEADTVLLRTTVCTMALSPIQQQKFLSYQANELSS